MRHPSENQKNIKTAYSFCDICSPQPSCGVTCSVEDGKIVRIEGTDGHPGGKGFLCTKGLAARQYFYSENRIKTPLRRIGDRGSEEFEPISWEEAFEEICQKLGGVKEKYGAPSVAFYSGYNKWYRPFLQRLCYSFGSVNYGSESSTCFSATAMSHQTAAGYDALLPDRKNCGTFLGWGYAPYYSRNAAGIKKGNEKVIIVDPRISPAVALEADLHLRPLPGTDGALAHAIARELIINDWIDHEFINNHVHGYEEYKEYVMQFTAEEAQRITGVQKEEIIEAARIIGENRPLCINQSASAYVHHKNGYQNHRAVHALIALTGSYDIPGGMIPTPDTFAHSRGGFATNIHEFEFEKYPKDAPLPIGAEKYPLWYEQVGEMQACDLARQIKEGSPYPVKAVVAHGMNFRMFNADTELEEALKELDFYMDVDLFLTDSAKLADIVLPACYSFERSELKVYPGGFLQYFEPAIAPVGMADDDIIFELARRLDVDDDLLKAGRDACYRYIFDGIDTDALKADPAHPHKAENVKRTPVGENRIQTPTGKFELRSTVIEKHPGLDPLPTYKDSRNDADPVRYPLQLVAGGRLPGALHSRLHDIPWLRALRPEPMADIHPDDAAMRGIANGDVVELSTEAGSITVKANITAMVLKGTVFMYHGYREADVNSIIPKDHNDPYSGFPGFRSVRCNVTKGNTPLCRTPEEQVSTEKPAPSFRKVEAGKPVSCVRSGKLVSSESLCTGCGACAVACMDLHDIAPGQKPYRCIEKEEDKETIRYYSYACMHCEDPECIKVCPQNCIYKDEETGLVLYNNKSCIGCGRCEKSCPAISLRISQDGQKKMEKCDGCIERVRKGEKPACVKYCPTEALRTGV